MVYKRMMCYVSLKKFSVLGGVLFQSSLESRVKAEQQQIEGVDGILAAMKEQPHSVGKFGGVALFTDFYFALFPTLEKCVITYKYYINCSAYTIITLQTSKARQNCLL